MQNDKALVQMYSNNLTLRNIHKLYYKSLRNKKISYVPYLVNMENAIDESIAQGTSIQEINEILRDMKLQTISEDEESISSNILQNMSTQEILIRTKKMFNSKMTNKAAESILNELKSRNDLLKEILKFTGNKSDFKDDLYYWQPGLLICDIYTLLLQLFNPEKLILKYKKYMSECIILNKEYYTGLFNLLKERYSSHHFLNIEVMKKDQTLFADNGKNNICKKFISHEYWSDNCIKCPQTFKILKKANVIDDYRDSDYVKYEFCSCLSFAEVEIGNKNIISMVCPIYMLEDLSNGCVKYKSFWISKNIIDHAGTFLVD